MDHTYKHLTDEQVNCIGSWADGDYDDEHTYKIEISVDNLVDWFHNKPSREDGELESFEFEFEKCGDETIRIHYPNPIWWWEIDDDGREELERIILEKLHLKSEWIERMGL